MPILVGQYVSRKVVVLAILAGLFYGMSLATSFLGGSLVVVIIGAIVGVIVLPPIFTLLASQAAGVILAFTSGRSGWTSDHERRAEWIVVVILVLLIIAGLFGR